MSKKIILIVGIAVLIILGMVFYICKINEANPNPSVSPVSSPSPAHVDNISDWQEYNTNLTTTYLFKDLKAPFSFKYPKEWNLDEGLSGIQIYSSDDRIGYEIGTVPKGKFMIQISPDIEDKNNEEIKSWCKNNLHEYDKPIKDILSEKYIEIDGNKSYLVDYKQENFDSLRQVCIAKSGFKVIIYAEPLDSNYLAIFDKILSTFKFIGSNETADWKTYRNEKYGFEFKYPKKYESNSDYAIWTLDNEGNILSEWGVNYGQETVFGIDVYAKVEKTSLLNNFGNEVSDDQKIIINNITVKKLEGGKSVWNVFMIENENYIYIIISSFSSLNNNQAYNEFEAILSTFKFIK